MYPLIVTGGSRGIGASISRLAGRLGFSVVVNFSESETEADAVIRSIEDAGGRAIAVRANISRENEVIELFQITEREFGFVGGLVNNAATTGGFSRVDAVTAETLEKVFAVNVTGTILCAREAVRRMSTRYGGNPMPLTRQARSLKSAADASEAHLQFAICNLRSFEAKRRGRNRR
jgi:NAD(P)-dependent dehydrogenase (short-subunit alcohol dehydrogenase family)